MASVPPPPIPLATGPLVRVEGACTVEETWSERKIAQAILLIGDYKTGASAGIDADSPIWRRKSPVRSAGSRADVRSRSEPARNGTHVGLNRFIWMPDATVHPRAAA